MKTKTLLLALVIIMTSLNASACTNSNSSTRGSSAISVKNFPVDSFDQINTESVAKIEFTQSNQTSVRAEGDDIAVNNLRVSTKDGKLKIRMIDKKIHNGKNNKLNLTIYVSAPELTKIEHEGVGTFTLKDKVELDNLKIEYDGVGNLVTENLICNNITVDYEGVGSVKLKGKAKTARYNSDGVGSLQAEKFEVEHLTVRASGVGSIKCYASQSIDISSDGIGSVKYWGNPTIKNLSKNGIGSIKEGR